MARKNNHLTPLEQRAMYGLAGVYGVRMLGLFMILPVFALYATGLEHVTPTLVGLAIGIYGLTQAMFQIPLGMLSDRIGRKPVILGGLAVFAAGSALAGSTDDIYLIILGRALQGSGAVAAAVLAMVADLTRESVRTRVMAFIGLSIGLSFSVAMVAGPVVNQWIGVPGIFWLTAALALLAAAMVAFVIPNPARVTTHRDAELVAGYLGRVLGNGQLLRFDAGIFTLHLLLTSNFVVVPLLLQQHFGIDTAAHWKVYLPVMLLGFVAMLPFIIIAEKHRHMKGVFTGAVGVLIVAELMMARLANHLPGLIIGLLVFFTAFNLLEASLPSLVSKEAPPDAKGTAMGIYSTSQFLGIFVGGALGGWVQQHFGIDGVFVFGALAALLWLGLAVTMREPRYLSSYLLHVGDCRADQAEALARRLAAVPGVAEAVVACDEGTAYLKVDRRQLDEEALLAQAGS